MYIKQKHFFKQNIINLCAVFALAIILAITPTSNLLAETSFFVASPVGTNPVSTKSVDTNPIEMGKADTSQTIEDAQQLQRVKEAVMQELRSSDFLQQQIEIGIAAYIAKQRVSQQAAAAEQARKKEALAKNVRRVDHTRDHVYGNPNAKVSIIEYSDFDCPYCKKFHGTPKQAVEKYNGQVNWVYRHFPLNFHPEAMMVAQASECAAELGGNDAFWQYTDALYARVPSQGKSSAVEKLVALATTSGLETAAFRVCLSSGKYAARVNADVDEGVSLGIQGTPGSILLNNETGETMVVSGALPFSTFVPKIEKLLN